VQIKSDFENQMVHRAYHASLFTKSYIKIIVSTVFVVLIILYVNQFIIKNYGEIILIISRVLFYI